MGSCGATSSHHAHVCSDKHPRRIGSYEIVDPAEDLQVDDGLPGGLQEKQVILRQLEDPEAGNALAGVTSLRKWLRRLRRAEDVGLSLPDASILLRGLTRFMKKLASNPEMGFRSSLIRNTLQLGTIPNHGTVRTHSEHLLSELEQMVHVEKKKNKRPCKFFLTDQGCRKGKGCKWSHELKDDKRCYTCGATNHMSNTCPTKSDAPKVQRLRALPRVVMAMGRETRCRPLRRLWWGSESDGTGIKDLLAEADRIHDRGCGELPGESQGAS